MSEPEEGALSLEGVKVVDAATLFAGPTIAMLLGDHGADVIKIEHPRGDSLRSMGWVKDGVSLWWTLISRNKRSVTLKLSDERGAEALRRLVADADVFVENFRPGTLERWGIGPEQLHEVNPRLVIVRMTGFGQTGPYAKRPGFGTLAESISGFAQINGYPDGPPTLPSFALGDAVAGLTGSFAAMAALWERERSGRGQVIDLSIYEPLFWLLGPQTSVYDQLGIVQGRTGNAAPFTAPRNTYQAKDGRWLGMSASAQSIAERVMHIIGRPDLVQEPWFKDHTGRLEHNDELNELIGAWIAERTADEVILAFEEAEGAIAPVLAIDEIVRDPQYLARETVITTEHPILGPLRMQNVIPRMLRTPGRIRTAAPELGADTAEVLGAAGYSAEELSALAAAGVTTVPAGATR